MLALTILGNLPCSSAESVGEGISDKSVQGSCR